MAVSTFGAISDLDGERHPHLLQSSLCTRQCSQGRSSMDSRHILDHLNHLAGSEGAVSRYDALSKAFQGRFDGRPAVFGRAPGADPAGTMLCKLDRLLIVFVKAFTSLLHQSLYMAFVDCRSSQLDRRTYRLHGLRGTAYGCKPGTLRLICCV